MLLSFTDAITNDSISINPKSVSVVLVAPKGTEVEGKTVIAIPTGSIVVAEDYLDVVGRINGELKND
jgi:hypothetical protein